MKHLRQNEVYYNKTIYEDPIDFGLFYIGNGDIFIQGQTFTTHRGGLKKVKLELRLIKSLDKLSLGCGIIKTNSYELIGEKYYDTIEEAVNLDEMINIWIEYKDFKLNPTHPLTSKIQMTLNEKLKIVPWYQDTLVNHIIYNKKLNNDDMKHVPYSPTLREKINHAYNEEIFDMNEFYNLASKLSKCY
jgi:hypothetical protein